MRWTILLALMLTLLATAAFAQTNGPNTAVGIGTGISASRSQSNSTAVAVGGGNATGGTGVGVGTGGNPTAAVTIAGAPTQTATTITNQGTSTVKNVPSVFSPGLAAAGIETCLGSVSGGGSWIGTGFSFGSTIPDPSCAARLDARTLWAFGLHRAALARLCLQSEIYRSMPDVCVQYLPQVQNGYYVAAPVPTGRAAYASTDASNGIMLVEGKTGREHLCSSYDEARQRCRVWADGTPTGASAKRVAAHSQAPKPAKFKSDPAPELPHTAATENKSEPQ